MNPKLILVCSCESILGAVVERLLAMENDLEVIGIQNTDIPGIVEAVRNLQPSTLILTDLAVSESLSEIRGLMADFPEIKLLTLSIQESWVHIFQERKVLLTEGTQLSQVIRSLSCSDEG